MLVAGEMLLYSVSPCRGRYAGKEIKTPNVEKSGAIGGQRPYLHVMPGKTRLTSKWCCMQGRDIHLLQERLGSFNGGIIAQHIAHCNDQLPLVCHLMEHLATWYSRSFQLGAACSAISKARLGRTVLLDCFIGAQTEARSQTARIKLS